MENKKEYIYVAKIIDAATDDILIKIESFSQEGLEEEMGHSKWTEAVKIYEEKLEKERLQDEEDKKELADGEETLPEDVREAMNVELEFDDNQDKKLEEDLVSEEEEDGETFAEHLESIKRD